MGLNDYANILMIIVNTTSTSLLMPFKWNAHPPNLSRNENKF